MPPATDAPPAPTTTDVSQGAPSTGAVPSSFRPPNPAFDAVAKRMTARLTKTAAPPEAPPKPEPPPEPITEPETPPAAPEPEETETETPGADKTEETPADVTPKKEKKLSPWRVIDDYKKTTAELKAKVESYEKELATFKNGKPQEIPVEWQERLQKAEARVKEYEDDLRFANYQKHPEFIERYQKPYDAAWQRAIGELAEVAITDPATGATRPAGAPDMLALLNLPLGEARKYANQLFGEFADDAMAHRKEIKGLFEAHQSALKDARENGAVREKQMREQYEAQTAEAAKAINGTWETANRETVTDPKYGKFFTPVEGDQKGNAVLAKGFELVDKAFKLSPTEPGITAEERTERVRRHAAMRHRAAAFGRMRQWIEERDARIEDLEKQLDEYSTSEPGQGGGRAKPSAETSVPTDPYARFQDNLLKRAHRKT